MGKDHNFMQDFEQKIIWAPAINAPLCVSLWVLWKIKRMLRYAAWDEKWERCLAWLVRLYCLLLVSVCCVWMAGLCFLLFCFVLRGGREEGDNDGGQCVCVLKWAMINQWKIDYRKGHWGIGELCFCHTGDWAEVGLGVAMAGMVGVRFCLLFQAFSIPGRAQLWTFFFFFFSPSFSFLSSVCVWDCTRILELVQLRIPSFWKWFYFMVCPKTPNFYISITYFL